MEQQAVEVRMGQTHLGFVDAAKGLGMLAIIWGHMDYLWSTSSVWFSSSSRSLCSMWWWAC